MTDFYNPYQFIPVDTRKAKDSTDYQHVDTLKDVRNNKFVRHDYWHEEGKSGRIVCTLKTLSPLVVGAGQTGGTDNKSAKIVMPYRDRDNNPAIPGNSLRGMIGSIVETISQSSLRVLVQAEKGAYSVRKPATQDKKNKKQDLGEGFEILKRIGILCKIGNDYKIYPLPMIDKSNDNQGITVGDYLNDEKYKKCCEAKQKSKPEIKCPSDNRDRRKKEYSLINRKCYQHSKGKLDSYECKELNKKYDSGIYYIRGQNDVLCKRGETYIPWDGKINSDEYIPVDASVIDVLENIMRNMAANEKDASKREIRKRDMLPVGYYSAEDYPERVWEPDIRKEERQPLVLEGDLLYFREKDSKVVELSYSSIWRKAVEGSLHGAFHRTAGENSLPWNSARDALTPAEALLGIVEDEPDEKQRGGTRNLASRVRFTDAVSTQSITLQEKVTLKILNSPKPPSPAMYFKDKSYYIAKTKLDLNEHEPNGRKYYLPHPRSIKDTPMEDWRTEDPSNRPHMRLQCTPIPKDAIFQFEVFFENLDEAELGLLLTAIQPAKQGKQFVHRLGLGKPIGLGHVQLSYQVETIPRQQDRYSVRGLKSGMRYQPWQQQLNLDLVVSDALSQLRELADPQSLVDPKTKQPYDVCYPFSTHKGQSARNEADGFKWFGANDSANGYAEHQALRRVIAGKPLPTLKS